MLHGLIVLENMRRLGYGLRMMTEQENVDVEFHIDVFSVLFFVGARCFDDVFERTPKANEALPTINQRFFYTYKYIVAQLDEALYRIFHAALC